MKVLTSLATKLYALSSQVSMPSECAILLEIGASIRLFGSVDVRLFKRQLNYPQQQVFKLSVELRLPLKQHWLFLTQTKINYLIFI